MTEGVKSGAGESWNWVRYVVGGHNSSNAVGGIKGDGWTGSNFHQEIDRYLAALLWNARIGEAGRKGHNERYVPVQRELEQIWRKHGDDPYFYDRYYLPTAQRLTGFHVGTAGMPIAETRDGRLILSSLTPKAVIDFTLDGTEPTAASPVWTDPLEATGKTVRALAIAPSLESSASVTFTRKPPP